MLCKNINKINICLDGEGWNYRFIFNLLVNNSCSLNDLLIWVAVSSFDEPSTDINSYFSKKKQSKSKKVKLVTLDSNIIRKRNYL
jgi:hypothetical protein